MFDRCCDRWNRSDSASTRASSSELVERLGDDVVGAGLEQGDAHLDVVRLGDREDRAWSTWPSSRAELLDHGRDRERRRHLVDDHEAVAARPTRTGRPGRPRSSRRVRAPVRAVVSASPATRSVARRRIESCNVFPEAGRSTSTGTISARRIQGRAHGLAASGPVLSCRRPFRPAPACRQLGQIPLEGVQLAVRRYELMLVLRPDAPDERAAAVIDRTTRYVVAEGGQIVKVAPWGRRRLAYPIDRYREGSYHIVVFEAPAEAIAELERSLQITEEVLRYLVTRTIKPDQGAPRRGRAARTSRTSTSTTPTSRCSTRTSRTRRPASRSTSPRAKPRPRPSSRAGSRQWRRSRRP